jgi:acetolactate synthase I/II/III large subunit
MTNATPAAVRGADLLAESLIASGIDTLFGLPGDTGVVFYDALFSRTDRLHHVLARDERHAATMADAYARITNRVGVVEVSSGGGTTYVVGGLGEAAASGIPILLITSDIHRSSRGTGALTEIDQLALFSAVTKWRTIVERGRDIPGALEAALTAATTGRPGPAALIIPEDVLDEPVKPRRFVIDASAICVPRNRASAPPASVAATANMLALAERPLIIAGSGVHTSQAWEELAMLAESAAVPVATTVHGKGAIPDVDRWSIGVVGNNGARDYANSYASRADAVLIVGSRANATDTNSWTGPPRQSVAIAQIDVDAGRAGHNFPGSTRLVGDAKLILGQIATIGRPADHTTRATRSGEIARRRTDWERANADRQPDGHNGQLAPAEIVRLLNKVLGPDTIVIADPGTPTPNVAAYWETANAGRTVIAPRGHGPMGYAIPAAIGAAFARPGQPIVSLTADGSFAMACGELETVSRFGLPILFVQFTNHSLGWIKMLQHLYNGRRYFGVDPGTIDAVGVAQACGVPAERVTDYARLEELAKGFAADLKPLYIDITVPHMIDHPPPVSSWISGLAGNATRPVY